MKSKIVLAVLISLVFSCKKETIDPNLVCNVKNPTEEIEWVRNTIISHSQGTAPSYSDLIIYRATYKGSTVLWAMLCCPTCNMVPPEVVNCMGETVGLWGTDIPDDQLVDKKVIFRTHNGICS